MKSVNVAIAGLGGLGSNILNALVRSGFNNFLICDFDKVEASNLNRQRYTLSDIGKYKTIASKRHSLDINDALNISTKEIKLEKSEMSEVFKDSDIVFEAFDKAKYKKALFESMYKENKVLIFGSGMAGISLIDSKPIEIKKIKENIYMVGDMVTGVSDSIPPLAPKVIAVASLMAGVGLDIVYNRYLKDKF